MLTARLPLARRACNADRNAATKNAGRYLHDLTRRRVIETSAMGHPRKRVLVVALSSRLKIEVTLFFIIMWYVITSQSERPTYPDGATLAHFRPNRPRHATGKPHRFARRGLPVRHTG